MRKSSCIFSMFIVVSILTFSSALYAGSYGAAGCGLGSLVFGDEEGFVQVFAATTNVTFGSQTFGISSGTSNCDASGSGSTSSRVFIEANREVLAKDISRGQGETLESLASILKCDNVSLMGQTLQQSFETIFPTAQTSDNEVNEAILSILKNQDTLVCSAL